MSNPTNQPLSSYAFANYGHDAKLYNGIHDLELALAETREQLGAARKDTERAYQAMKSFRTYLHWALKRITNYESISRIKRVSEDEYVLEATEAIEYAYENVIAEARAGLRGVRISKSHIPANAPVSAPQSMPDATNE